MWIRGQIHYHEQIVDYIAKVYDSATYKDRLSKLLKILSFLMTEDGISTQNRMNRKLYLKWF